MNAQNMKSERVVIFLLIMLLSFPTFANRKARVITESGKKWDVIFLKMSNDTIYVKARKPDGAFFNVSGHKSKFRKVEFIDGSLLDLTLSDFPPAEEKKNINEGDIAPSPHDTVSRAAPSLQQDTYLPAKKLKDEPPPSTPTASSSQPWSQPLGDTTVNDLLSSDTLAQSRSNEKSKENAAAESEAMVLIETRPPSALVKIDGKDIIGKTPIIAKHLKSGEHLISAYNDSLQASKTVSIENREMKRLTLTLEKTTPQGVAVEKKNGRYLGISLGILSIASFGGSAGTYYLYNKHHSSEVKTFNNADNSLVKGSNAEEWIEKNKAEHKQQQMRLNISQILLGAGVVLLGGGVILYF